MANENSSRIAEIGKGTVKGLTAIACLLPCGMGLDAAGGISEYKNKNGENGL